MAPPLVLLSGLLALGLAQDTSYCPDGWHVSQLEGGDKIECILLSGLEERVTNADAAIICDFHGGWLVDMDEGHGPQKNNLLKSLISDADGQGGLGSPGMQYGDQWWIGAKVYGPHNDHQWGNWLWDHNGEEISWYDWMRNEPNDWRGQNCLTFLKDQDIFGFGAYHWNDWDCSATARFICERAPYGEDTTTAAAPATTTAAAATTTAAAGTTTADWATTTAAAATTTAAAATTTAAAGTTTAAWATTTAAAGLDLEWTITGQQIEACVAPGTTLNFVWDGPWHNVVDLGENLQPWLDCTVPEDQTEGVEGPWSTSLPREGVFLYLCGVSTHCVEGRQKAMITVSANCP